MDDLPCLPGTEALESAEDFLIHFGLPYDPEVLATSRLHILQRFHNYLRAAADPHSPDTWRELLARAYADFVRSDPLTEGVFNVFKRARGIATVPVSSISRRVS